jgi:molybdopterin converting factor subunit 1
MLVTIRLFARLREMAGGADLQRELPDGATARNAWEALVEEFPDFDDYSKAVSCAVNQEYARMTSPLSDGDEVAFLPPVSGGAGLEAGLNDVR